MNRLERFLRQFESKNTVRSYRLGLTSFFKTIYPELSLEEASEKYFTEKRDIQQDLDNFFIAIKERPPKTVQLFLSCIRTFFIENDIEIPEKYWRKLRGRKKGNRALTMDKVPSNLELKKIIRDMPIQGKALYLTLASSGMRIGEALKLRLNDIDLERDPAKINIRGEYTKTGNPRIAFISSEAKEAINDWLKVRGQYLEAAINRSQRYEKPREDDRLFPFLDNTAYMIWRNALSKAGYSERDNSTNRLTIHPHVLRKFFRSKAATLIPVDIVEALMGHEGYLTEVYRKHSEEDLAKFYKQCESALLVFTDGAEIAKIKRDLDESKEQLQKIINGLVRENMEQKEKIAKLERELEKFEEFKKKIDRPEIWRAIAKLLSEE